MSARGTIAGFLAFLLSLTAAHSARAAAVPLDLPRYSLEMDVDTAKHIVRVDMHATWTNTAQRPASELIFNVPSHYAPEKKEVPFFAKTLEIMRMSPSEVLDKQGPAFQFHSIELLKQFSKTPLNGHFSGVCGKSKKTETQTALVAPLPEPVQPGQTVTVRLQFSIRLPQKCGRWGQWNGVTYLATWLPVFAVYDDEGWHPVPFIPWHQPFFNESGCYRVKAVLPANQKIACTGTIVETVPLDDGRQQVTIVADGVRDFAFLCSAKYQEFTGRVGHVHVRCCAAPEHAHYAREFVQIACKAIEAYSQWFGPYPYPEFTIAESSFGWLGNECSTLVMIDDRIFAMPHLANNYVDYLLSHEICHQWWYNMVGTNGFCETWMDEGLATYFSHRLQTCKHGKNNTMLSFPKGLSWLPNIRRETYRASGMYGTIGRGEQTATVQEIQEFGHLANLFSMCYEKGSKIVGMIEDRLGETSFLDFMRLVFRKYQYRILRVADFQRELEAYTGKSWEEFFHNWLYTPGLSDWSVEKVEFRQWAGQDFAFLRALHQKGNREQAEVTVILHQKAEINEQTILGFQFEAGDNYPLRIPIVPAVGRVELPSPETVIEPLPDQRVRVTVKLPREPVQISVDPDRVLVDKNEANNHWIPQLGFRFTPLYTFLDETDFTAPHDRWNFTLGPWIFDTAYNDPWYARSPMAGARVGLFRTQHFLGGVYAAYRTDYRDVVVGADSLINHEPWPHAQFGFNVEQRVATVFDSDRNANRASIFARHVFKYGSCLYLPPIEFVEVFGVTQDNFLPVPRTSEPNARRFDRLNTAGVHYRQNYLTPYWDPEGGYRVDLSYQGGVGEVPDTKTIHQVNGDLSYVQSMPQGFGWFSKTRLAAHLSAFAGWPHDVEFFSLGGNDRFRGFDLAEKQGSRVWIASLEWRVPLFHKVCWDVLDHCIGIRNLNLALFYDAGDARTHGHSNGPIAHAAGVGVCVDTALFGFIERATLRLDVAKAVNYDTPTQFWLGFVHPF